MAGQPTMQGGRDGNFDGGYRTAALDAYFPVLGNGAFFLVDYENYTLPSDVARMICQHAMNFAGALEHFSVKINGNTRTSVASFSIRLNDIDTTQFVVVTEGDDGKYTCTNEAATFAATDYVSGYCFGDEPPVGGETPGLLQVYVQMTPDDDEHSCYRTGGGSSWGTGVRASVPIAGSLAHYNSQAPNYQEITEAASRTPSQMIVRATGTYAYLHAYVEVGGDPVTIAMEKNSVVPTSTSEGPFILATDTGFYVDTTGATSVKPRDKISLTIDGADSSWVWSTGINFAGAQGNEFIDFYVQEDWNLSGSPNDPDTRDDYFNYFDPDPRRFQDDPIDNPRAILLDPRKTVWIASLFGTFEPVLTTLQEPEFVNDGTTLGREVREPRNTFLKLYEVEPTFDMGIRSLRVHMDVQTSGVPITVGIMRSGGVPNDLDDGLQVECSDPGWYENTADEINVGPQDDTVGQIVRQAAALFFKVPLTHDVIHDGGYWVLEAISHISSVSISYAVAERAGECFTRVLPDVVPVDPLPCTTRLARSLKITRPDGVIVAYTEHDEPITHEGTTYQPVGGGFQPSASESSARMGDVGNMEATGYASDEGMPLALLFGGQYDNAVLEAWLLPWGEDNDQPARRNGGGVLGKIRQRNDEFTAEVLSIGAYLKQKSIMRICQPTCWKVLGSAECGVDLNSLAVTGIVTGLTEEEDPLSTTVRRRFFDIFRTEDDGWFTEGIVTFVSGDNAGQSGKIKFDAAHEYVIWDPLVYPIAIGDEYVMTPGCDKTAATCKTKYDNHVNFGGFEFVPGSDAAMETPSGKLGQ